MGIRTSPHRGQTGSLCAGNSVQQTSQIGTGERCGRGEPQRAQPAGKSAQPIVSSGLRSTRATARHAEVSEGGTSSVSEPGSLKTAPHIRNSRSKFYATSPYLYLYALVDFIANARSRHASRNSPYFNRMSTAEGQCPVVNGPSNSKRTAVPRPRGFPRRPAAEE